jgi:hypothetical protein
MARRRSYKTIMAILISLIALTGCSGILDGPFNQDGVMVPDLLYANNSSGYVTYWDDDTNSYRTYDQFNNVYLNTVAYNSVDAQQESIRGRNSGSPVKMIARGGSRNYKIAGTAVMPLTQLNHQEMAIQDGQGCTACHKT